MSTVSWWTADDVANVEKDLARHPKAGLWGYTSPAELAHWVFADPALPAAGELAAPSVDPLDADLDEPARASWALAGWYIWMTVPNPVETDGKLWFLNQRRVRGRSLLRVTLGRLETLWLFEDGDGINFHLDKVAVEAAFDVGVIDEDAWFARVTERDHDPHKTLRGDKVGYTCDSVDDAWWALRQPPVLAAARLVNAMSLAVGGFTFDRLHRPERLARAWSAAQVHFDSLTPQPVTGAAFDRPYRSPVVDPAALTDTRAFDKQAYVAGCDEHDRLSRWLIDTLAATGILVGTGLAKVPVDLAWQDADGRQYIAEVKSLVGASPEDQLRLGLGQVLEYRHRLALLGRVVTPILLTSAPVDEVWRDICRDNGVTLLVDGDPLPHGG
ncbi:hypothetical protein O7623_03835 [Solwaraspora sp. WMMD791]|uniref:hypothetical protein n=1 Tax=Solwaraspora sp. WMMD791 TaxID=3016086 RepID=UPI002499FF5D|nr:hypothetical protein [Solwaraspora sp. WMMD791]WFE28354.1 hypothetical protein O7623_03835 [Solwaraspora sp. WMMD791]